MASPSSMKDSWQWFKSEYIETGWFDSDRIKTFKAMRTLWEMIPATDLARVPAPALVFAPSSHLLGEVYPWHSTGEDETGALVYLSPALEKKSQREVNFTVAHEFAHAILHPVTPTAPARGDEIETEADALAQRWGFPKAGRRFATTKQRAGQGTGRRAKQGRSKVRRG